MFFLSITTPILTGIFTLNQGRQISRVGEIAHLWNKLLLFTANATSTSLLLLLLFLVRVATNSCIASCLPTLISLGLLGQVIAGEDLPGAAEAIGEPLVTPGRGGIVTVPEELTG